MWRGLAFCFSCTSMHREGCQPTVARRVLQPQPNQTSSDITKTTQKWPSPTPPQTPWLCHNPQTVLEPLKVRISTRVTAEVRGNTRGDFVSVVSILVGEDFDPSEGPSVEAALSMSPTEAQRTQEPRKTTIGVRKPASAKKGVSTPFGHPSCICISHFRCVLARSKEEAGCAEGEGKLWWYRVSSEAAWSRSRGARKEFACTKEQDKRGGGTQDVRHLCTHTQYFTHHVCSTCTHQVWTCFCTLCTGRRSSWRTKTCRWRTRDARRKRRTWILAKPRSSSGSAWATQAAAAHVTSAILCSPTCRPSNRKRLPLPVAVASTTPASAAAADQSTTSSRFSASLPSEWRHRFLSHRIQYLIQFGVGWPPLAIPYSSIFIKPWLQCLPCFYPFQKLCNTQPFLWCK